VVLKFQKLQKKGWIFVRNVLTIKKTGVLCVDVILPQRQDGSQKSVL